MPLDVNKEWTVKMSQSLLIDKGQKYSYNKQISQLDPKDKKKPYGRADEQVGSEAQTDFSQITIQKHSQKNHL